LADIKQFCSNYEDWENKSKGKEEQQTAERVTSTNLEEEASSALCMQEKQLALICMWGDVEEPPL
jgi:hypothetical protein